MLQEVSIKMIGQHAQIDLQAAAQPDAGLGRALGKNRFGPRPAGEMRDDVGGVMRRADDVDIADGHLAAAQTSREGEALERRSLLQVGHGLVGDGQRRRQRRATLAPAIGQDAALPVLDRLASQARHASSVPAAIAASRSASDAIP